MKAGSPGAGDEFEVAQTTNGHSDGNAPGLRSAFGYYGSKLSLAKKILKNLPPHNCWVELFGGGLALTMAKSRAPIEIVNDLDEEVVNAFRQLRDRGTKLAKLIELTPYSRVEFDIARESSKKGRDVERARKFLVHAMMSVNGVMAGSTGGFSISDTYSRQNREARVNRWHNYSEKLEAVTSRLRGIRIERKDGIDLLADFSNKPATLVYVDPPYLAKRTLGYKVEASDLDFHERLLSQALLCKCMIVISSYESETYTKLLGDRGGWRSMFLRASTKSTNGESLARREVLWFNKFADEALLTNRLGLKLTGREIKDNRVNPARGPIRRSRRVFRAS